MYFLRLKELDGRSGEAGLIAVGIDPSATADRFDFDLGETDCGLSYADRSHCTQGDVHIDRLRGRIVDALGAAIPNADILVFELSGKLLEQMRGDGNGDFASTQSLTGTYRMVAKAHGFAAARSTVQLAPVGSGPEGPGIKIQLGLSRSCSLAAR